MLGWNEFHVECLGLVLQVFEPSGGAGGGDKGLTNYRLIP